MVRRVDFPMPPEQLILGKQLVLQVLKFRSSRIYPSRYWLEWPMASFRWIYEQKRFVGDAFRIRLFGKLRVVLVRRAGQKLLRLRRKYHSFQ